MGGVEDGQEAPTVLNQQGPGQPNHCLCHHYNRQHHHQHQHIYLVKLANIPSSSRYIQIHFRYVQLKTKETSPQKCPESLLKLEVNSSIIHIHELI